MLGDSTRAIQYWVCRFEEQGFSGLYECEKTGRPGQLSDKQLETINKVLRNPPDNVRTSILNHKGHLFIPDYRETG